MTQSTETEKPTAQTLPGENTRSLWVKIRTRAKCFLSDCSKDATLRTHYLLNGRTKNINSTCHGMNTGDITPMHHDWHRWSCEAHRQTEMDTKTPEPMVRNTSLRLCAEYQDLFLDDVLSEVPEGMADEFFVHYDDVCHEGGADAESGTEIDAVGIVQGGDNSQAATDNAATGPADDADGSTTYEPTDDEVEAEIEEALGEEGFEKGSDDEK